MLKKKKKEQIIFKTVFMIAIYAILIVFKIKMNKAFDFAKYPKLSPLKKEVKIGSYFLILTSPAKDNGSSQSGVACSCYPFNLGSGD